MTIIAKNQFTCINPLCYRKFETKKQFSLHFFKSLCSEIFKSTNKAIIQSIGLKKPRTKLPIITKTKTSENEEEENGINMDYMNPNSDKSTSQLFYPESSTDDNSITSEEKSTKNHHIATTKLRENTN